MVSSCSGVPGACIGYSQGFDGNQSLCANLTAGQTYYLVVDQFASPTCIPSYNISISAPSGVAAGITCGNPYIIPALPFSLAGETTEPFAFKDLGEMISLGMGEAALTGGGFTLAGPAAFQLRRLAYLARLPGKTQQLKAAAGWLGSTALAWQS